MATQLFKLIIIMCSAYAPLALAEDLPKEGDFNATYYLSGITTRSISLGNSKSVALIEFVTVSTNDSGKGLFNNMTAQCIALAGTDDVSGYCVYSDTDGDKFIEPVHRKLSSSKGDATLGWGTGKYKGIEGSLEFERVTMLPATGPDTFHQIGKKRGHYKLP